uniref:ubiquitin thioesterase otulin-like n=1 Tax=Styela clava TaxID=7725 RepID=UPI001939F2DF|nr:ubiquitin thioesterase otulin-like [Styela clava]
MLKISQSGEKSNNNNNKNDSELSDQEETPPSSEEPVESFKGGYSSQEALAEDSGVSLQEFDDSHDGVEYNTTIDRQSSKSVSGRIDLLEYSEREWNGKTLKAEHMKLGYFKIIEQTGYKAMRRIRGDNYCGLRATCFQVLSQNLNVLRNWDRIDDIESIPQKLIDNHGCNWLAQWSFANRLQVLPKKKIDTMVQCLKCFNNQLKKCKSIEDDDSRIQHLLKYFNSGNSDEILLFEAIKLLMLYSAVLIHDCMKAGKEIPDYGMLLFARDTSETPEQLMKQHLNTVGDTGGLEQIEMMLLGYTLKVTIRVVRPSQAEQEDFMSYYPDNHKEDWDTCDLIAEDDRHYNIIVD